MYVYELIIIKPVKVWRKKSRRLARKRYFLMLKHLNNRKNSLGRHDDFILLLIILNHRHRERLKDQFHVSLSHILYIIIFSNFSFSKEQYNNKNNNT